jgi:hypothetical protein
MTPGVGWARSLPVPIPRPVSVSWWIICSRSWIGPRRLLTVSEQRNVMLAQMIRGGAAGYRGGSPMAGAMPPMMGCGPGVMSPIGGMGGSGLSPMTGIPNVSGLSSLIGAGGQRGRPSSPGGNGLNLHSPVHNGPGADAFRAAVRRGLDIKGIIDPVARANWETGLMVVAGRESDFSNTAVNDEDSNAADGNHSVGTLQFTRTTYEAYHEAGTSTDRRDNVGQVCAFINYAMGKHGVSADGSDLADKIQQADPTRPPKGY